MDESPLALIQKEHPVVTLGTDETILPQLSGQEDGDFIMVDIEEEEEEEENKLLEDELRQLKKFDSMATIEV